MAGGGADADHGDALGAGGAGLVVVARLAGRVCHLLVLAVNPALQQVCSVWEGVSGAGVRTVSC